MKKKISLIVVVIVIIIALALGAWLIATHRSGKDATKQPAGSSTASKYTHLDITLKNGHLVQPAATYLVKPGTTLEFGITSNVLGKISVPTDPPQIITFTQSPLVFHFTVSKPGSYPLAFQANDGSDAIQIGTIVVRSNTDK